MKFQQIWIILVLMTALLILPGSYNVVAHEDNETDDDHDHMMDGDWGDGWWGFTMVVIMACGLLFFVVIIALLFRDDLFSRRKSNINALALLDERYARGEVPRAEYEIMKADLKR